MGLPDCEADCVNPEAKASLLSIATFSWMLTLVN